MGVQRLNIKLMCLALARLDATSAPLLFYSLAEVDKLTIVTEFQCFLGLTVFGCFQKQPLRAKYS